jgi:hypothetical protein
MASDLKESLGKPSLQIAGFQVWVHNQAFPDSASAHDTDWLDVTVHCGALDASVWVSGAILSSSAFDRFASACVALYKELHGEALLEYYEPNVSVKLTAADRLGHVPMTVKITPDHMTQEHRFQFELDQSYLPAVVQQCRAILNRYPNPHTMRHNSV